MLKKASLEVRGRPIPCPDPLCQRRNVVLNGEMHFKSHAAQKHDYDIFRKYSSPRDLPWTCIYRNGLNLIIFSYICTGYAQDYIFVFSSSSM
jgi:hypothetical protein